MKLENFIKKWSNTNIQDCGVNTSSDYEKFQSEYRTVLRNIGKQIDMTLYKFIKNHYEFSAVLKSETSGRLYYISISDVRYFPNKWNTSILYRTMEHPNDWKGGNNHFSTLENLAENLKKLDQK